MELEWDAQQQQQQPAPPGNTVPYSSIPDDPSVTEISIDHISASGIVSVDDDRWTADKMIWIYCGPCVFLTGLCGNVLILLVMRQVKMKGTSTGLYLQAMAVADLVAITTGIVPDWLEARYEITLKEMAAAVCKLEKFLFYTSGDTSIWICVVFTVDRFVAVCFPMENMQRCPPHHAKFYVLSVFLAAVGKNLHVFITRGTEWRTNVANNVTYPFSHCLSPNESYAYFEKYVRPWIVFTFVNVLPFCIIVFCNLFIVRAMIRIRRSHRESAIVSSKDANNVIQMTVLCLSASICFVVCVTPSMILLIGRPYWSNPPNPRYNVAKAAGNLIFYVNHSINFFLYCMTGIKFRLALRSLFASGGSTGVFSGGTPRNSLDLGMLHRLQKGKTGKGSLYSSAPCIVSFGTSNPVNGVNGPGSRPDLLKVNLDRNERTYMRVPPSRSTKDFARSVRSCSEGRIFNIDRLQPDNQSLHGQESRL